MVPGRVAGRQSIRWERYEADALVAAIGNNKSDNASARRIGGVGPRDERHATWITEPCLCARAIRKCAVSASSQGWRARAEKREKAYEAAIGICHHNHAAQGVDGHAVRARENTTTRGRGNNSGWRDDANGIVVAVGDHHVPARRHNSDPDREIEPRGRASAIRIPHVAAAARERRDDAAKSYAPHATVPVIDNHKRSTT